MTDLAERLLSKAPLTAIPTPQHHRFPIAWTAALTGAITLMTTTLLIDLAHGAMGAAIAAALVAIVPSGHWRYWVPDQTLPQSLPLALGAAGLTSLGAFGASVGGSGVAALGQLILGWTIALLVLTFEPVHNGPQPDRSSHTRLAIAAAGVGLVFAVVAIVTGAGTRPALALLLASPVAVAVFVSASDTGGARFRNTLAAVGAGTVTGPIVLNSLGDGDPSTITVAILAVGTIGFLVIATASRAGVPLPRRLPWAGVAVGLLAAGAGGGLLGITAVAALVVVHERDRRAPALTPTIDTSAVAAARIVAVLTAVAMGIRLYTPRGLWLDEATSVHQARLPLMDMMRLIYDTDNHPPLHHLLLWADIRLVGDSELAVRFPAIVLGVLLVPMLYLTGRELFDRRVGVLAAAIGTVAPLAVWYGQEARMYSQFMLLALVAVYAQSRILRGGGARWWLAFGVASTAVVLTQYFAVLHVGATFVVFAVEIVRRRGTPDARRLLRGSLATIAGLSVALAPLVPFALHQAINNQKAGFGLTTSGATGSAVVPPPSISSFLTNIQWSVFGYQSDALATRLVALWPVGLLLLLLVLGRPRRHANRSLLLIAGLPLLAVFVASMFAAQSRSLAEVRYFIGAVPIVFLLLAAGVTTVFQSRQRQTIAAVGLIATLVVGLVLQGSGDQNPRLYQYREAMSEIRDKREPGDVVVYSPEYLDYVLEYYDPGVVSTPLEDGLPDTAAHVFLVEAAGFADSAQASDEITGAIADLEASGLQVLSRDAYAQIIVWRLG